MARKKSGAQRDRLAPVARAMKDNPIFSRLVPKRGRPKGETGPIEARRGMIELDFLFLVTGGGLDIGERHWTDSRIANELLLDDLTRWEKYKLGKCLYRKVHKETLRRRIAAARHKFCEAKISLHVRT
jgi:hypothetical protein